MTTREIALRCAAAMDPNLLKHGWPSSARERYNLSDRQYRRRPIGLIDQLDACKSDEARRLIMGFEF